MTNMLFSLFAFIITISFLVFIHEFGHFWVARRFGVRIEKFSVGFGKPIIKWHGKRDNTEYSLSWLPLGGYVKMYGEVTDKPTNEISEAIDISDLSDMSNVVDTSVEIDLSADNSPVSTGSFSALPPFKRMLIAFAGPAVNLIFAILALWTLFIIGVPALTPTIGSIEKNSALISTGIAEGDNIVLVNGRDTLAMRDVSMALIGALGSNQVSFETVNKNGQHKTTTLDLSTYKAGNEMAVEKLVGFNWAIDEVAKNLPVVIQQVSKSSPAEKAGLLVGDKIISADGVALKRWQDFVDTVKLKPREIIELSIERNKRPQKLTIVVGIHPNNSEWGYAGVSPQIEPDIFEKYRTIKRYGVIEALPKAIVANYIQGELMLKTLGRLIFGKASVENLGGPLRIADYSGRSLSAGYVSYFHFLASISLILAVMNLLPIPVLDGGHIVMCAVEMVRGKKASEKTLEILMRVGASIILPFMLFTISIDIWRYLFK